VLRGTGQPGSSPSAMAFVQNLQRRHYGIATDVSAF
jgi:hypothetical protein